MEDVPHGCNIADLKVCWFSWRVFHTFYDFSV